MNRKKTFAILLPVIACAALAGTGFGAWVFTDASTAKVVGSSFEVTDCITYGDVTATLTGDKFSFDQNNSTKEGKNFDTEQIITVTYSASNEAGFDADYDDGYTYTDKEAASTTVGYNIKMEYVGSFNTYAIATLTPGTIQSTSGASSAITGAGNSDVKYTLASGDNVTITDTWTVSLAWVTANVPQDKDHYEIMKTALKTSGLKVTVTRLDIA